MRLSPPLQVLVYAQASRSAKAWADFKIAELRARYQPRPRSWLARLFT